MKTNQAPWDYKQPVVIKSQLIKLCAKCGAPMFWRYEYRCCSCPSSEYVELYEHQAETFRRGLIEIEEEKAKSLALDCMPQLDVFLEIVGASLDMDDEQVAIMNSWIEEEDEADVSELTNHAYMDGTWQDERNSRPAPY